MAKISTSTANNLPMYFNVTAVVGKNAPNQPEDVQLVSWLMCRVRENSTDPSTKAALAGVQFTSTCTPALIQGILGMQASGGLTQDGRVDPCTSPNGNGSHGPYMITAMNLNVKRGDATTWPRLDQMFKGNEVRALTKKVLLGPVD